MLTEALLLGLLLLGVLCLASRRPSGLPPGVWGWPLVGQLPSKAVFLGDQVKELRPIYGDIITWRTGSRVSVFLCNFRLIKKALSKLECSHRPDLFTFGRFGEGILFSSGLLWQVHRRFVLRQLRDLGMGKTRLEAAIQQEASFLVQELKKDTGRPRPLPMACSVALLNVIWRMVADHRYSLSDEKALHFVGLISAIVEGMQSSALLLNFFPWLEGIVPHSLESWLLLGSLRRNISDLHDYMTTFVEEHLTSLDPANPRDLLDAYLIEMQKDNPNTNLNMQTLHKTVTDLFTAGTETTGTTMLWAVLYLTKDPKVQTRVQQEIDSVVPKGTLPSLQHEDKLHYLKATIHEVHRSASVTPLGLPHFTSTEIQLEGYAIPKGTVIRPHLECCHTDPNYWEKPLEFYPEHFLDQNGKFNARKEGFLPFSVGRRACAGEALARMELFLFLSAMLQSFTFSAPDGEDLCTERDPQRYSLNRPKPFNVVITERK